jgi:transcriptional regulator with XRE-family HTH domain
MKYVRTNIVAAFSKMSSKLAQKLSNKGYRDAYMDEQVRTWVARQIRALREQRGWSQIELARRCDKPQSVISRLEDPDYGKLSLQTLFDLRAAFDVGLEVRFIEYQTAFLHTRDVGKSAMEVASFDVVQSRPDTREIHTFVSRAMMDFPAVESHPAASNTVMRSYHGARTSPLSPRPKFEVRLH